MASVFLRAVVLVLALLAVSGADAPKKAVLHKPNHAPAKVGSQQLAAKKPAHHKLPTTLAQARHDLAAAKKRLADQAKRHAEEEKSEMKLTKQEKGLIAKQQKQLTSAQHKLASKTKQLAIDTKKLVAQNKTMHMGDLKNLEQKKAAEIARLGEINKHETKLTAHIKKLDEHKAHLLKARKVVETRRKAVHALIRAISQKIEGLKHPTKQHAKPTPAATPKPTANAPKAATKSDAKKKSSTKVTNTKTKKVLKKVAQKLQQKALKKETLKSQKSEFKREVQEGDAARALLKKMLGHSGVAEMEKEQAPSVFAQAERAERGKPPVKITTAKRKLWGNHEEHTRKTHGQISGRAAKEDSQLVTKTSISKGQLQGVQAGLKKAQTVDKPIGPRAVHALVARGDPIG